ncbi:MAG: type 2 lanthipeptide synthetase LanM [Blautia sp.]|nr:type 2 lanthipeptide synthetase LanM [Blautia sp.]
MQREKQGVFEEYYEYLQQTVLHKIKENRKGMEEIPELAEELLEAFTKQVQTITIRTLILEMEICEENGMLKGAAIQERYEYFSEMFLGNPAYRKEIYEAYPMLYEGLVQTMDDFVRNMNELLDRFALDRKELNRRLYPENPCREIRKIGGGGSDSHRHGRWVLLLELDNGERLVYKPRSMAVDEAYAVFLGWVFENIGMSCWWYQAWDRGEYGWCQWVSSLSCISREELSRYYYRNGVLLCVSYLLGSEDMHYENLIAHGEYPVIVDLEMTVGSRGAGIEEGMSFTEQFYRDSVLQIGILPLYTWNEAGEGVNVGAINGEGGQLVPVVMPVVADPGTVRMHIEYRRPKMGEGKNLAILNGEFIEPYEFLQEIIEGFENAYSFFTRQREKTLEMLGLFRNVSVRYLVRDTQQYAMMLMTLGHPDLLVRDSDRKLI